MAFLLKEDREHKNRSKVRKFIRNYFVGKQIDPRSPQFPVQLGILGYCRSIESVEQRIRENIPNIRMNDYKFALGATRLVFDIVYGIKDEKMVRKCLKDLNQIIYEINTSHRDEYSQNLEPTENGQIKGNPLSFDELKTKFFSQINQSLEIDKQKCQDLANNLKPNPRYKFAKIDGFLKAEEYSDYVSWCIAENENLYAKYTNDGVCLYYFALRDDYKTCEEIRGENSPLDDYGLSMIAINVNPDGTLKNCTCRWNHQNGGNDHIMTTEQLTRLFGQNFYDIFKPYSKEDILEKYKDIRIEDDIVSKKNGFIKVRWRSGFNTTSYIDLNGGDSGSVTYNIVYQEQDGTICESDHKFVSFDKDGNKVEFLEEISGKDLSIWDLSIVDLKGLPKKVNGMLSIGMCHQLKSLEGCPQFVGRNFFLHALPNISSFEHSPRHIGGEFCCRGCGRSIKDGMSTKGITKDVNSIFLLECDTLLKLEDMPTRISGMLRYGDCKNLNSLAGSPREVGELSISNIPIISLDGSPETVHGNCKIFECEQLTSLHGLPKTIEGDLDISKKNPKLKKIDDLDVNSVKGRIIAPKRLQSIVDEMRSINTIKESFEFYFSN